MNSGTSPVGNISPNMKTLIHKRVELARAGKNPTVICRVQSGWVVLGDSQFLPGYTLLLADPVVESLNDMTKETRSVFLEEMACVGDALLRCTDAYRVNYEILGNLDPALHAHIFPRYMSEPKEKRNAPVWYYGKAIRELAGFDLRRDRPLMERLRDEILKTTARPNARSSKSATGRRSA
jgi:diadenosine tetraphosphate (Ap4A) HIT family hydrolase